MGILVRGILVAGIFVVVTHIGDIFGLGDIKSVIAGDKFDIIYFLGVYSGR